MTNRSEIVLKFSVAQFNGQSMSMEFFINDQSVDVYPQLDDGIFVWRSEFAFPSNIDIKLSNKGPRDTQLDANGNIIKDKHIKLIDIIVDRIPCARYYVNKIMLTTDQGSEIMSNYWGFNGKVRLDFSQTNSFFWSIDTQNKVNS